MTNVTESGQSTPVRYKVGHMTQYGTLLAEAVIPGNSGRINSLYANEDKSEYTLIEWANSDKWDEYAEITSYYADEDEARRFWLIRTFGIIL